MRISVPENVELGTPLYAANAHDKDSGKCGIVTYRLINSIGAGNGGSSSSSSSETNSGINGNARLSVISTINSQTPSNSLFAIDSRSGHLTLSRHLDYETAQRHSLIVTATDSGEPPLSANLTILVEVQDINDNPPVFERKEYAIKVMETMPINSEVSF